MNRFPFLKKLWDAFLLSFAAICGIAAFWLTAQDFGAREVWLNRLTVLAFFTPAIPLVIGDKALGFIYIFNLTCIILGVGYAGDIGSTGHGITAGMLILANFVGMVGAALAIPIRNLVKTAYQRTRRRS